MPREPAHPPGFPAAIPSASTLKALHSVMVGCTRCDLFLSRTQVVPGAGNPRAKLFLVGEAPGEKEDAEGVPFVGRSGALLDAMLAGAELDRKSVFVANVVRCRPPKNRNPRAVEIRACAGWLREQIRLVNPALVVTLGRFALQHFLPAGRITQLQGEVHPIDYDGRPLALYPLLHPSAVLRNPDLRAIYSEQFSRLPGLISGAD
jgi:uracil-DNA glycosylase